jgi:hypothetical protein
VISFLVTSTFLTVELALLTPDTELDASDAEIEINTNFNRINREEILLF